MIRRTRLGTSSAVRGESAAGRDVIAGEASGVAVVGAEPVMIAAAQTASEAAIAAGVRSL